MKRLVFTVLSLCAALVAGAQSFSEIELDQARAIWLNSGNAAGISASKLLDFKDISLNFDAQSGDFAHTYDASSQTDCSLKGRGVASLAGFKLAGSLLLDRSSLQDVAFNNSLYEVSPFTRPYWFLDYTAAGYDWSRTNCAADLSLASPLFLDGRLAAGINVKLDYKSAARDADISAAYSSFGIEFAPSAIFKIDNQNTIGLALRFANTPEKSSISQAEGEDGMVAFARGLGQYKMRNLSGVNPVGDIAYQNNYKGVSIQYDRLSAKNNSELLLDLGLTTGNSYMQAGGSDMASIDDICTDFSLTHLKGEHHNRILTLAAQYRLMYDFDKTFGSSIHSLEYMNARLLLDYMVYFGAPTTSYSWFMGLRADINYLNQKRVQKPDGIFTAPEALASALLGKNTSLGSKSELMCSLRMGYHFSFGAQYSYGATSSTLASGDDDGTTVAQQTDLISTMLYSEESYYLKQYYYLASPQVRYSVKISDRLSAYGLVQGSFIKPVTASGSRLTAGGSIGIIF